jgi:hypothetical protein
MNNLELAVKIAGLNPEKLDLALLVGGLATLKEWSEKEVHLSALGVRSMCVEWRKKGQSLLNESSINQSKKSNIQI